MASRLFLARQISQSRREKEIVQTSDFEIISVTNNTKIGTATVVIRGNGKYCGMKKASFKIVKNNF